MINCSKFFCSKKLLNPIFQLLNTIRANDKKSENWLTIKNYLPYVYFEQFHFQTKKFQLLDKGFGKCHPLDTIYSKENGVHVRQLGQGLIRLGQVRCTCIAVRLGVRLGQVLGQVRCQFRLGVHVQQLGQVRLGQVYMYGSQVMCTCMAVRLGQELGQVGQFRS